MSSPPRRCFASGRAARGEAAAHLHPLIQLHLVTSASRHYAGHHRKDF